MVIPNMSSGDISLLINDGAGIFAAPANYEAGDAPKKVYAVDYDGDGDCDMATINYYDHKVSVFMNLGYCGDLNGDGFISVFDVMFLIDYLYSGGPEPESIRLCDVNSDSVTNIFDIVFLLKYLYMNGPEPECL